MCCSEFAPTEGAMHTISVCFCCPAANLVGHRASTFQFNRPSMSAAGKIYGGSVQVSQGTPLRGRGPCSGVVFCPTTAVGGCVREEVCFADAERGDTPKMPLLGWGQTLEFGTAPLKRNFLRPDQEPVPIGVSDPAGRRPRSGKTLDQPQNDISAIRSANATPESSAGQGFDKAFIDREATSNAGAIRVVRFTAYGLRRLQPSQVGSNEERKAEARGE